MSPEVIFRVVFAVLVAMLYGIRLWHVRKRPTKNAGMVAPAVELPVVITTCAWTLSLIAYASGISWSVLQVALPDWIRWLGVGCFVCCLPTSFWTYRTLGTHFSPRLELLEDHALIQDGPYHFVRHPMYAVLFLSILAACLTSANLVVMVTSVPLALVMTLRMKKEEAMLERRFGWSYCKYAQCTGAIVPKIRIFN